MGSHIQQLGIPAEMKISSFSMQNFLASFLPMSALLIHVFYVVRNRHTSGSWSTVGELVALEHLPTRRSRRSASGERPGRRRMTTNTNTPTRRSARSCIYAIRLRGRTGGETGAADLVGESDDDGYSPDGSFVWMRRDQVLPGLTLRRGVIGVL
ncbi:uncharacterized protein KD926_003416 [Aspergillus affinis]|uniref:uncharacterized protein n=1 Tax=Aspergillus affinis TaxID=1070780 RepID=UPI0022FEC057|nr:uncharacterized protein KD926_003416 [Aspergillus affinis]KAI9035518.1 hypothetical protein KD926_003416 [Aspergillus affinis]